MCALVPPLLPPRSWASDRPALAGVGEGGAGGWTRQFVSSRFLKEHSFWYFWGFFCPPMGFCWILERVILHLCHGFTSFLWLPWTSWESVTQQVVFIQHCVHYITG